MEKQYGDDEVQIDLLELFYALKKRIWIIVAATVIGGGITGAYSAFVMIPQYTSTATVYVLSKETTLASLADLQIGSQLTKDYTVIMTSRPVLQAAIDRLNLDIDYRDLRKKIVINNPPDTRILTLSVRDSDPYMARALVNEIAFTAAAYIGDIMEMIPPKVIEDGELPTIRTSPILKKNVLIGALTGMLLVSGVLIVRVLLNDTIKTEEDIERYLKLSSLAVVPVKSADQTEYRLNYEPKKKHSHKKKRTLR